MRNEVFELFIEEMGEATMPIPADPEVINKYRGILPNTLLQYWQDEGWSAYANGLFWIVNPDDYQHIIDIWLKDSPIEQIDRFYVIARSAFGRLYVWAEHYGKCITVDCPLSAIMFLSDEFSSVEDNKEIGMQSFFILKRPDRIDMTDDNDESLFAQALAKFGPLASNEVYGFFPALVLGGEMKIENLKKVNLDVHLHILREFDKPTLPFANRQVDWGDSLSKPVE